MNIRDAADFGVTGIMQPFVRNREDLITVKRALGENGAENLQLVAKIENREGMERLETLLPVCDAVCIARGDLGNDMQLWQLPAAQKKISAACRAAGRYFMVATQMLASMENRAVPTRAEVNDIFNTVADGASGVMVTGETAVGQYPVDVIRFLAATAREAEKYRISH
jgi:pyruvate kinase